MTMAAHELIQLQRRYLSPGGAVGHRTRPVKSLALLRPGLPLPDKATMQMGLQGCRVVLPNTGEQNDFPMGLLQKADRILQQPGRIALPPVIRVGL